MRGALALAAYLASSSALPAGPAWHTETLVSGLAVPWAMAFLDDTRAIVSERAAGRLTLVDLATGNRRPLDGGPGDVYVAANAGMLDVVLHPAFDRNGWVYFAYTAGTASLNTTVVERARLAGERLVDRQRLFEARPWYHNSIVYGCRLAFADGRLFLTVGDRWDLRHLAQSPGSHLGKVLRIEPDGSAPADNPFVGTAGAMPEVFSIGNRNPQGLAVHPVTGALWSHEHGPLGGDEVNVIRAGGNYGWPTLSFGKEYSGEPIGEGETAREGMQAPVHYWVPSIAPSDMLFYTGSAFPEWQGDLFIGALAGRHLNRLRLDGETVVAEERLLETAGWRIRMLEQGPDGYLYLGTDAGDIHRLVPGGSK